MLAGLFAAFATRDRHDAAYETLLLLQNFLQGPHAADHLEAIRGEADIDDEVVDALKTLHWQIQKRRMELAAKPRRGQADDSVAAMQAKQAILGSEQRLRRQQAGIMKIHRTRTPARNSRR